MSAISETLDLPRCQVCAAFLDITTWEMAIPDGAPRYRFAFRNVIAIRCHTCRLQLEGHCALPQIGLTAFAEVALRANLRQRAVGVSLRAALASGEVLPRALFDSDMHLCVVEPVWEHTVSSITTEGRLHRTERCHISGAGLQTFATTLSSLAEALLVLPFEYGIPTDTGWIPQHDFPPTPITCLDLRPYRLPHEQAK